MHTEPRPHRREAFSLLGRGLAGLFFLGLVIAASLALVHHFPGGENLRFPWEALHSFIYKGENPYRHLSFLYGRAAQDHIPVPPEIYPFHTALVWFGLLGLTKTFTLARTLALIGAILTSLATLGIAARMFAWRPGKALTLALAIFVLTWHFAARALLAGNVAAPLTWLLLAIWASLRRERDTLAGGLLALTFIRPGLMVGVIVFVLLWAVSRRRWKVWGGFWGVTLVLMALSLWLLPSWPLDATRLAFQTRGTAISPRTLLSQAFPGVGRQIGWLLVLSVGGLVGAEWTTAFGKPSHHALWTASLTVWGSLLLGPRITPSDQVLLLVPLMLIWGYWLSRWKAYGRPAVWLTAGLLWLVPWLLAGRHWHPGTTTPTLTNAFLAPLMVLPLLYTVRWWASRAHVLPPEEEMLS